MEYDSKGDTLEHIGKVRSFMSHIVRCLLHAADKHDDSKLRIPEKEHFDRMTPKLSGVTFGSDEYRAMLKELGPAIEHHNKMNPHHPEYYVNGINGMNLVDIIEMLCDWKAATLRHADGDIQRSLKVNAKRFGMDKQLVDILSNTIRRMGW